MAGTCSAAGTRRCWGRAARTRCRCDRRARTSWASSRTHWEERGDMKDITGYILYLEETCSRSAILTICYRHPACWSPPALRSQTSPLHGNTRCSSRSSRPRARLCRQVKSNCTDAIVHFTSIQLTLRLNCLLVSINTLHHFPKGSCSQSRHHFVCGKTHRH